MKAQGGYEAMIAFSVEFGVIGGASWKHVGIDAAVPLDRRGVASDLLDNLHTMARMLEYNCLPFFGSQAISHANEPHVPSRCECVRSHLLETSGPRVLSGQRQLSPLCFDPLCFDTCKCMNAGHK